MFKLFRTKVECAGLCLSYGIDCFAFQFTGEYSKSVCKLISKDEICSHGKGNIHEEVYIGQNEVIPSCKGTINHPSCNSKKLF